MARRRTPLADFLYEHHVSQAAAAVLAGLSESQVQRIASGRREPTEAEKSALRTAFPESGLYPTDPHAGLGDVERLCGLLADWLQTPEAHLVVKRLQALTQASR